MQPNHRHSPISNIFLLFFLIELLILGITALVCWWLGWLTPTKYAVALIWAGLGLTVLVAWSFDAGGRNSSKTVYNFFKPPWIEPTYNYTEHKMLNRNENFAFTVLVGLLGILNILIGLILLVSMNITIST
ncbi:MAG TPA: hypothetical protein PK299_15885 [Anaerolineales bacterium]|nr:hypothetical protein [Anaerolineales bacterium]